VCASSGGPSGGRLGCCCQLLVRAGHQVGSSDRPRRLQWQQLEGPLNCAMRFVHPHACFLPCRPPPCLSHQTFYLAANEASPVYTCLAAPLVYPTATSHMTRPAGPSPTPPPAWARWRCWATARAGCPTPAGACGRRAAMAGAALQSRWRWVGGAVGGSVDSKWLVD
jgi:hypothetical protein